MILEEGVDITEENYEKIVRAVVSGNVPFPYIRQCLDPLRLFDFIRKRNQNVSFAPLDSRDAEFPAKFAENSEIRYQGSKLEYLLFIQSKECYLRGDIVTDFFAEEERLKCSVQGQGSPISLWNKEENVRIWLRLCREKCGYLNIFTMHEAIFESHIYKECNQYKPLLVKSLVQMLGAKRVLDLSAGWGDRLIGCLAAGVEEYLACDPNPELQKVYRNIIDTLCPRGTTARVVLSKAEDLSVPEGRFDLFHSSPPFWIKEEYQGMDLSVTLDSWIEGFLFKYLEQGMKGLRKGGYFTIYINDYGKIRYVGRMNRKLREMGHKYHGMIGSGTGKPTGAVNSVWVWSKN